MKADKQKYRKRTMSTEKIIELYKEGKGTTELGKLANVSPRYIRMLLNDKNIERRAHGSWKRKYTVHEDYFKTWSNNMAYILGFFAADGMVARDAQLISFSQKEKYILEDIRREMGSDHPIFKVEESNIYILNLYSKILKTDIMTLHGILPKKGRSIEFPSIPKQYMNHFIRGYFDGDGFVKYEKYFVSIVGGSKSFMKSLRDEIENNGFETNFTDHETHFRVYVSGRKTIKLFSIWLYENKGLYLKRKYEEFQSEKLPVHLLRDREYKTHKNAIQKRKMEQTKNNK